jgi:5-hydroxyisourate hydrolase-like protein (transthyretin family)
MTPLPADLTRRKLLGLGLLGAGAVVIERVPIASDALAADGGLRARSAVLGLHDAKRLGPIRVPGGFDLAGLKWAGRSTPQVELRARRRGGRWTEWLPVGHAHDHGPDATPANAATDPVWTGRADEVELRLSHGVRGLTLHTVRADGLRRRIVVARAAQTPGAPAIIPRATWGGSRLKTRGAPQIGTVQMAFVHHTVNANTYTAEDSPAIVLAIAKYHISSNGWNDIGYNFLVDRYGQIFEGRAGGIDQAIIGAQAQGFNSYSTGISNIGTFESVSQTDAAINAQAQLIAWKLAIHGVSPDGTVDLVSAGGESNRYPTGRRVTFQRVSGHRDADKTSCPGSALYAQIPTIRARAIAQDYPIADTTGTAGAVGVDQLSIAAAATQVAAYTQVQVNGALRDVDGGPISGVEVRIQKLGATRWSTAARATTNADGAFTAPVIVRQTAKLRAYYGGDLAIGGEALTSSEVAVSAIPQLPIDLSAKHVGPGQTVTVKVTAKPTRSRLEVTLTKRGHDGRYRTVTRSRVKLSRGTGSVALRIPSAGLYGVTVASPADDKGIAVTAPRIHVRCARGVSSPSDATHIEAGGVAETSGGAATIAGT